MVRKLVVAGMVGAGLMWAAAATVDAAVLCQKKSGAIFARDTCKKKETPFDASGLVGTLPTRVTTLESTVATLQTSVGDALTKTSPGTVAGYATVESDGTLSEHYSSTGGTVASSRTLQGAYSVSFGFSIRPDQPIVAVP